MKVIQPKEMDSNFISLLSERWGLITVADGEKCNPMTVSLGTVGYMWKKPVATVYVVDSRYTYELMEKEDYFGLVFLPADRKQDMVLCGHKSGRDVDKVKECGLTVLNDQKAPYFEEAELTLICRKLYKQKLDSECFTDKSIPEQVYPTNNPHYMYVGEIEAVVVK